MSNTVNPSYEINYISQLKRILVGRNNNTIYQKFKIDNNIQDTYYFQLVSKNNQLVELSGFDYQFIGSYIDAKQNTHVLFFSDDFTITDNVLSFKVNTYTSEYVNYVKVPRQIDISIRKKATGIDQVILRDVALAYPTPIYEGEEPSEVVAGFGLQKNGFVMSLQNPLTSSFGVGRNINYGEDGISVAVGQNLTCLGYQLVIGRYNVPDTEAAFIIGGGTSHEHKNVFTVDYYNGNTSGGTFYSNGVQVATINEVSGITYTAGEGIGIDSNNVISLTATIPDAVSSFPDSSFYIKSILSRTSISATSYDANRWTVGIDYDSLHNAGFAYTSAIPTSTSQLTNDSGFITTLSSPDQTINFGKNNSTYYLQVNTDKIAYLSSIPTSTSQLTNDSGFTTNSDLADYALTSDLANYATTGALDTVSSSIPTKTSDLTNDSNYATSSYVQNVSGEIVDWVDGEDFATKPYVQNRVNICPISNDVHVYTQNDYILSYYPNYNIYITKQCAYSDGKVYINALSTVPTNNTAITFENHIKCYDYSQQVLFDGFVIDQNINVIGDLPSTFVAGTTYVFTRRLININNITTEFISFAYSY